MTVNGMIHYGVVNKTPKLSLKIMMWFMLLEGIRFKSGLKQKKFSSRNIVVQTEDSIFVELRGFLSRVRIVLFIFERRWGENLLFRVKSNGKHRT